MIKTSRSLPPSSYTLPIVINIQSHGIPFANIAESGDKGSDLPLTALGMNVDFRTTIAHRTIRDRPPKLSVENDTWVPLLLFA